jgi:hypothetical protein
MQEEAQKPVQKRIGFFEKIESSTPISLNSQNLKYRF